MGLLQPDSGLIFWMTLAFLVVLFILAKFGFPVILRSLEERKAYIDNSLASAAEAERRMEQLDAESRQRIAEAESRRVEILRQATQEGEEVVRQAQERAQKAGAEVLERARREAEEERDRMMEEARREIGLLAIAVSEKMLQQELSNPEKQLSTATHLLREMEQQKGLSDA